MLDQVDRLVSHALARGLTLPSRSTWGCLEGFRRADQDVDRTPGNWLDGWHPLSRASLEKAKAKRQSRRELPAITMDELFSCECKLVASFPFERDANGGLDKRLASNLIEAREAGQQAWIKLPSTSFPLPPALDGSLRLGAAWWCEPPEDRAQWDAFAQSQSHWSEIILRSSSWDQWVWPWSSMIEQGLILCLHGKKPAASRLGPPDGWRDRKAAAWGGLGMKAWQSAQDATEGMWEDMWIGLLVDRFFQKSLSCE